MGRDEVVIFGDYVGFSEGELQEVIGSFATLQVADGSRLPATWYSHTTSAAGARFELRFRSPGDASATLNVPFALTSNAAPNGGSTALRKTLSPFVGLVASVTVALAQ